MALKKTIKTACGVDAKYWKIIRINKPYLSGLDAEVFLGGYASERARKAGHEPIEVRAIRCRGLEEGDRGAVYKLLKASMLQSVVTGEEDESGEPITESVEVNAFADAEDV